LVKKTAGGSSRHGCVASYSQGQWRQVVDGFEHGIRHERLFGAERTTLGRLRDNADEVWNSVAHRCRDDDSAQALIAAILSAARWAIEAPSLIERFEKTTRGWRQAREGAETLREFLKTIKFVDDPRQGQLVDLLTWFLEHVKTWKEDERRKDDQIKAFDLRKKFASVKGQQAAFQRRLCENLISLFGTPHYTGVAILTDVVFGLRVRTTSDESVAKACGQDRRRKVEHSRRKKN
jgi:hypothetical protein